MKRTCLKRFERDSNQFEPYFDVNPCIKRTDLKVIRTGSNCIFYGNPCIKRTLLKRFERDSNQFELHFNGNPCTKRRFLILTRLRL